MRRGELKKALEAEEKCSRLNRLKILNQWRKLMRLVKVEDLRKEIEIISQITRRRPRHGFRFSQSHLGKISMPAALQLSHSSSASLPFEDDAVEDHARRVGSATTGDESTELEINVELLTNPVALGEYVLQLTHAMVSREGDSPAARRSTPPVDDEEVLDFNVFGANLLVQGDAKTQPLAEYQVQRRGGMGKAALTVKDEELDEGLDLLSRAIATVVEA